MAVELKKDCFTKKLIDNVRSTFKRLEAALKARETQLLRQIDVILQQYSLNNSGNMKCFNKIHVVFANEVDILKAVSNFGIIDFEGINLENSIYQIEEYENPSCDHVSLHKCLKKFENTPDVVPNKSEPVVIQSNQIVNESESKVSSDVIVQNLLLYASTLKSLQSNEDLKSVMTNMEIKISEPLSNTPEINLEDSSTTNNTTDASFEFHEINSKNSVDDSSLVNSSLSNVNSSAEHSSFEFHESSFEENRTSNISLNQEIFPTVKIESTKFYNRHDSRYAKISNSSLIESIQSDIKNVDEMHVNKSNEINDNSNSEIEKNEKLNDMNTTTIQNINLEHPIQQWMQQISREPEIEPIQNNELMEYVKITTTL